MAVLGILFSIVGLGFVCWLLFSLAVYAFPFAIGLTAGLAVYNSGAGVAGGFIVGALVGGLTLVLGQLAFASVRAPLGRAMIGLLYAVPAAIAGYSAAFGLAQFGIASHGWCEAFAIFGALLIGGTAWARLALHGAAPPARSAPFRPTPLSVPGAARGR